MRAIKQMEDNNLGQSDLNYKRTKLMTKLEKEQAKIEKKHNNK